MITVLHEAGYDQAMLGLSFNKKQPVENMPQVADKLAHREGGHNKFLEHIMVWLEITQPRYWWQEFDTYRVGISKQSESTMHTIVSDGHLRAEHFEGRDIYQPTLDNLNKLIDDDDIVRIKRALPEGFLQKREIVLSYKSLRHIKRQRAKHRLPNWQVVLDSLKSQLEYPEFIWRIDTGLKTAFVENLK